MVGDLFEPKRPVYLKILQTNVSREFFFSKASFSKSFIGTNIPVHFRFSYSSWKNLVYYLVHICTEAIQYIQMLSNYQAWVL